jgi:hypothetical protein
VKEAVVAADTAGTMLTRRRHRKRRSSGMFRDSLLNFASDGTWNCHIHTPRYFFYQGSPGSIPEGKEDTVGLNRTSSRMPGIISS